MNFDWRIIAEKGNHDEGYVDIYVKDSFGRAIVVLTFLPQHSDITPRILIAVFLEGSIKDWTKGIIASIFHDAEDYIKNVMNTRFRYIDVIDNVQQQIFTIKNVDEFEYINHGDYNFID
ncbi:MAG: hypothetical protein EOP45_14865 [Sphingobacteriaceae bacterium]|nr:MAG: hypothetical protein EOP45_14865 [Sphingobacteriaceae bacterium]